MRHSIGQDGFTLVEVMVALIVIITGMLGVMGMQYMAVHGNAVSRQVRVATNMGQDFMEWVNTIPRNNLQSILGDPGSIVNPSGIFDPSDSQYNRSTTGGVNYTRMVVLQPGCSQLVIASDNNTCYDADNNGVLDAVTVNCVSGRVVADATVVLVRSCWIDKYANTHAVSFTAIRR